MWSTTYGMSCAANPTWLPMLAKLRARTYSTTATRYFRVEARPAAIAPLYESDGQFRHEDKPLIAHTVYSAAPTGHVALTLACKAAAPPSVARTCRRESGRNRRMRDPLPRSRTGARV